MAIKVDTPARIVRYEGRFAVQWKTWFGWLYGRHPVFQYVNVYDCERDAEAHIMAVRRSARDRLANGTVVAEL